MRYIFALPTAILLSVLAASCQRTSPCETLTASAQDTTITASDAEDADSDDPGCPAGLSCNSDGGCNADYPHCCNGVCQKPICSSAGAP